MNKTAMHRRCPSAPMKLLLREFAPTKNTTHLDYGCGHGADLILNSKGYDPYTEFYNSSCLEPRGYSIVTCFYVLNTLVKQEAREQAMDRAWACVASGGTLWVAVRLDTGKISGEPLGDGVATKKGFQTLLGKEDWLRFFETWRLTYHPHTLLMDAVFEQKSKYLIVVFHRPQD